MTSVLADTIPGIRVVKAFAQERREIERFRAANDRVFAANCRVNTLWSFFEPVVSFAYRLGIGLGLGIRLMADLSRPPDDLTFGDLISLRAVHQLASMAAWTP